MKQIITGVLLTFAIVVAIFCSGYYPGKLTTGSMLFVDTNGNVSQANSKFYLNPNIPSLFVGAPGDGPLGMVSVFGSIVTSNRPIFNGFQQWNDGGVTFTGIVLKVTDSASAAGSLLMGMDVGGVQMLSLSKAGVLTAPTVNASTSSVNTIILTNPLLLTAIGDLTLSNLANNPYKGYTNIPTQVLTADVWVTNRIIQSWATSISSTNTNVTLNLATNNNFNVMLLTNATMTFSNFTAGQMGDIIIQQDTNGTRALDLVRATVGATVTTPQSVTPTLTTNASATDWFHYVVDNTGTNIFLTPGERRTVNVTTNLVFALGTRYTNGPTRLMPAASWTLSAAAAGTAKVTLYVEHVASKTNKLSVSAGPLASLVTVEPLAGLIVGPYEIYRFEDETSGVGATAAVVADTCSRQEF